MNFSIPSKQTLTELRRDLASRFKTYQDVVDALDDGDERKSPDLLHKLMMSEVRPVESVQSNFWQLIYWAFLVVDYEYRVPVRLGLAFLAIVLAGNVYTLLKSAFTTF